MMPNAGKDTKRLDFSYIANGNAKGYSHTEKQLAASPKTKHALRAHYLAIIFWGNYHRELKIYVRQTAVNEC